MSLNNYDAFGNRFVDVGAGGPASFTFTVASNATWVRLSTTKGSVSPKSPETRVYASVADWSKLSDGANAAVLTFTATSRGYPALSVNVNFVATKNTVPSDFKGEFISC